jgi:hypothetical protein
MTRWRFEGGTLIQCANISRRSNDGGFISLALLAVPLQAERQPVRWRPGRQPATWLKRSAAARWD